MAVVAVVGDVGELGPVVAGTDVGPGNAGPMDVVGAGPLSSVPVAEDEYEVAAIQE